MEVTIANHLPVRQHWCGRHPRFLEYRRCLVVVILTSPLRDGDVDLGVACLSTLRCLELRVISEFHPPDGRGQCLPLVECAYAQCQPAVVAVRWIATLWRVYRMTVSPAFGEVASNRVLDNRLWEERDAVLVERHVDILTLARALTLVKRRKNSDGGMSARDRISVEQRATIRPIVVCVARCCCKSTACFDIGAVGNIIAVWAGLAEARNRDHDNFWIHCSGARDTEDQSCA